MSDITKEKVLHYHKQGKIGIDLTKPCDSQHELSYVKEAYHNENISYGKQAYKEHLRCIIYGYTEDE